MYRLVPTLLAEMGEAYPELKRAEALVSETLKLEETRFRETLARGLKLLDEATVNFKKGDTLPGEVAFKLYDTYGFPRDLTEDALRERRSMSRRSRLRGGDGAARAQRARGLGSGEAATDTLYLTRENWDQPSS
jgi:alanyl-tRNA synthetase